MVCTRDFASALCTYSCFFVVFIEYDQYDILTFYASGMNGVMSVDANIYDWFGVQGS